MIKKYHNHKLQTNLCAETLLLKHLINYKTIKNSEYDKEIPQSQAADKPIVLRGRATQPSRGERSGSVVECLTRDRRAAGSSLTGVTALCL